MRTAAAAAIMALGLCVGGAARAQCPGDSNGDGRVTIAELVAAVGSALHGCPTATNTVPPTAAATRSRTPTATSTTGGTATPSATPTRTPSVSLTPLGPHACTFVPGTAASHVTLNAAGFATPLAFAVNGSTAVDCGAPGSDGRADCTCQVNSIEPITIVGVGKVCITPLAEACPSLVVDCDGGAPLGIADLAVGNIGACTGNADCDEQCNGFCEGRNAVPHASGCTGFCTLGAMQACNLDADCLPNDGSCNGPDPVASNKEICQCECLNLAYGNAARSGELQCHLGTNIKVVDVSADCTAAPLISVGQACIPLTTELVSSVIDHANFTDATLPAAGPVHDEGSPIACADLQTTGTSGMKLRGAVSFFGSALGDLVIEFFTDCQ